MRESRCPPEASRWKSPTQPPSGTATTASWKRVVAARKRSRSSADPTAASSSMSASRASCDAYIGDVLALLDPGQDAGERLGVQRQVRDDVGA